ncbi:hypothetical protein HDU93_007032 [Gonapodya sp. JEL0774]|nr:hypothetical protein HDU93_007032 [Gonapodya sp. JEL0774]
MVFPGGKIEEIDRDTRWEPLLNRVAVDYRPNTFKKEIVPHALAGIRETFEECGILMCSAAKKWTRTEVTSWRARVHNNASAFLDFCLQNDALPLTAGLTYWSNWITPKDAPKRFDVKFFLTVLPETTEEVIERIKERTSADGTEILSFKWMTPSELIHLSLVSVYYSQSATELFQSEEAMDAFNSGQINLIDPQFAQLAELHQRYPKLDQLRAFVRQKDPQVRTAFETMPCSPEFYVNDDGTTGGQSVVALPGDPIYSEATSIPGCRVSDRHRILLETKGGTDYRKMEYVRELVFDNEQGATSKL